MFSSLRRRAAVIISGVLLVLTGFVIGTAIIPGSASSPSPVFIAPVAQSAPVLNANLTADELQLSNLYRQLSPSVVSITVVARHPDVAEFQGEEFALGSGTGFVIDTQGHVVTNNHVVDGATSIEVNFFDGTIVSAEIIGLDPDSDIAVLKVNLPAERLSPVRFGNSDSLVIGQTALAIGNPFGQDWTLTMGIVSALGRTIEGLGDFSIGSVIQTDAAINPGNSGGPLLNLQGEVIGVNSQIISRSRSNSGIGFAVPSNLVQRVVNELLTDGQVDYSYLGISGAPITLPLIESMNLPNNLRGVVVGAVFPGSSAANAGLVAPQGSQVIRGQEVFRSADIITAINDVPVYGMPSLIAYLASNTRPGDTVNLSVWRDGQTLTFPAVLTSRPR